MKSLPKLLQCHGFQIDLWKDGAWTSLVAPHQQQAEQLVTLGTEAGIPKVVRRCKDGEVVHLNAEARALKKAWQGKRYSNPTAAAKKNHAKRRERFMDMVRRGVTLHRNRKPRTKE